MKKIIYYLPYAFMAIILLGITVGIIDMMRFTDTFGKIFLAGVGIYIIIGYLNKFLYARD